MSSYINCLIEYKNSDTNWTVLENNAFIERISCRFRDFISTNCPSWFLSEFFKESNYPFEQGYPNNLSEETKSILKKDSEYAYNVQWCSYSQLNKLYDSLCNEIRNKTYIERLRNKKLSFAEIVYWFGRAVMNKDVSELENLRNDDFAIQEYLNDYDDFEIVADDLSYLIQYPWVVLNAKRKELKIDTNELEFRYIFYVD